MPSINEELDQLPLTGVRWHECKGMILFLPRTGLTVVPYELIGSGGGAAACVVVYAPAGSLYPVGGYNVDVSLKEIERAIRKDVPH